MSCDPNNEENYSSIVGEEPLRDVLGGIRAQGARGPSPTGQKPPPLNMGGVRILDSFFLGAPPRSVNYITNSDQVVVAQPLVVGACQNLTRYPTPPNQTVAITYLEFYMLTPLGGGWARLPDDFAQLSFAFRIMADGKVALWHTVNAPGLAQNTVGFDTLNQNVLGYTGDAPAYLIFASGSVLTVDVVVLNAGLIIPVGIMACARVAGLQVPSEQWELATS